MKMAIVTGATGFLGGGLCRVLSARGYDVYALVQEGVPCDHVQAAAILPFDLFDPATAADKLPRGADVFYHMAWAGVSTDQKNDTRIQFRNIQACYDCLRLAQQQQAQRVVMPGSVSEYAYSQAPVDGQQAPSPCDIYSACKVSAHMVCDVFARQQELPFVWALLPSIYGPGREDNNIITYTIKSLLRRERPSFTKLEQLWDYLYLQDALEALALLGEKGRSGQTYAIGSGVHKPLREYIVQVRDAIDPKLPLGIGELPYKTGRIDNSIVDIDRLQEDTGFRPAIPFAEGIAKTIDYFAGKGS